LLRLEQKTRYGSRRRVVIAISPPTLGTEPVSLELGYGAFDIRVLSCRVKWQPSLPKSVQTM
jgi:hypothetical protein